METKIRTYVGKSMYSALLKEKKRLALVQRRKKRSRFTRVTLVDASNSLARRYL